MRPNPATETAPAKINLTLHVTGRRADGYHLLDSLVAFADVGDVVAVALAERTSLTLTGPFAAMIPTDGANLVLRATRLVCPDQHFEIILEKNLPPASGIGGGSADAAATIRAIRRIMGRTGADDSGLAALGADLPVCLASRTARMRGIGEDLTPARVPSCPILMVNPGIAVPTPDVFAALENRAQPPMPDLLPDWSTPAEFCAWLTTQRNDLEPPALRIAPCVGEALTALIRQPGALMARMSGSGATCFALFNDDQACAAATVALRSSRSDWWIMPGRIGGA